MAIKREINMDNKVNLGRQLEFDVAKVLAIIYMVIIHVYENMSSVNYGILPNNLFRGFIEFTGGPLAAPVFMFAMGIGMVYTRNRSPKLFAVRGLKLLGMAYLLNFVRMTVPYLLSLLAGVDSGRGWTLIDTIGLVDILQFAGMAFLLVALLNKWKVSRYGIVAVALLLQAAGTLLLHTFDGLPSVIQYALGLLFHTNRAVAFPLTLWFAYPAFGIFFGEYLQSVDDKKTLYNRIAAISACGLLAASAAMKLTGWNLLKNFALAGEVYYIQTFATTVWTLFVVGIQLYICHRFSLRLNGPVLEGTKFISSHLNTIYIIQWVLVSYSVVVLVAADMPMLPAWAVIPAGILIAALSSFAARYVNLKV